MEKIDITVHGRCKGINYPWYVTFLFSPKQINTCQLVLYIQARPKGGCAPPPPLLEVKSDFCFCLFVMYCYVLFHCLLYCCGWCWLVIEVVDVRRYPYP